MSDRKKIEEIQNQDIDKDDVSFELPKPALNPGKSMNIGDLRLTPGYAKALKTNRVQTSVPVGKPPKQEYFMVHPDFHMDVGVLLYEAEGKHYALTGPMAAEVAQKMYSPSTLYLWVTRGGTYGLWPAKLPLDDGTTYDAWTSAHEVCGLAMKSWVRFEWNKSAGSYDAIIFSGANPGEPSWPSMAFEDIVASAFRGRVIDNVDHFVLRRLRGEV